MKNTQTMGYDNLEISATEIFNQKAWTIINPTKMKIDSLIKGKESIEVPNIEMLPFELKLAEKLGVTLEKIRTLINRAPANE